MAPHIGQHTHEIHTLEETVYLKILSGDHVQIGKDIKDKGLVQGPWVVSSKNNQNYPRVRQPKRRYFAILSIYFLIIYKPHIHPDTQQPRTVPLYLLYIKSSILYITVSIKNRYC